MAEPALWWRGRYLTGDATGRLIWKPCGGCIPSDAIDPLAVEELLVRHFHELPEEHRPFDALVWTCDGVQHLIRPVNPFRRAFFPSPIRAA